MLAFGFLHPWMLIWLAASAAPIAIHFWNRRKQHEVSWAAVEFLIAAVRKQARTIRLQQWILLAIRTLVIALIVMAVAQPFTERLGLQFIANERTHRLLVIDGSFSMAYRPADQSHFDRARQLAVEIVESSRQGDGFTLVLMSTPPRVVVGTPALDPNHFLQEVHNLDLLHLGGDLSATLVKVEEILERASREQPGLVRHEIYFLTDLGRTSWLPEALHAPAGLSAATSDAVAAYRAQVERLAERASLVVVDLGNSESDNLAVSEIRSSNPFAVTTRDVTVEAVIRNYGRHLWPTHSCQWWVDGQRIKQERVDIPPDGETSISFSHRFLDPGSHVVEVRIGPDRLDIDNRRGLSLFVKPYLNVLCVSGKSGSAYYLALALDPEQTNSGIVHPRVVPESALLDLDLEQFDAIFLTNVAQFTTGEARRLDSYLRQGGGLVFFLGDRVIADRYNRELAGQETTSLRILPARLGEVVSEAQAQLDPLDYRHPVVSPFRGRERSGLLTTPIYKYFRLTIPESSHNARVALAFQNGDPVIVEESIHAGRSIVVSTAASLSSIDPATQTAWTAMPTWPSFLPIVQELLALAVDSQRESYNRRVGQPLEMSMTQVSDENSMTTNSITVNSLSGTMVTVDRPDGERGHARIEDRREGVRWVYLASDVSGIYAAHGHTPSGLVRHFAVNVDTAESDLSKIHPRTLPKPFVIHDDLQGFGVPKPTEKIGRRGFHKWFLDAAVCLLLLETFLAWRFGYAPNRQTGSPQTQHAIIAT